MKSGRKTKAFFSKIEIVLCVILFITMLVSCGLYINIKMNGKVSSLPSLPDKEKQMLLRSVASESVNYSEDLLEPIFVGIKNGNEMIAALPDNDARHSIESDVYESLQLLFSGKSERFEPDDKIAYIDSLKNSDRYMLIGFYGNIPSTVFYPCLSDNFDNYETNIDLFYINYIFLLPDYEDKLYAVTVSNDFEINMIYPRTDILFNKIISDSYDVNDGYSYFDFLYFDGIHPVLVSSINAKNYKIDSIPKVYGSASDSKWLENLFDLFLINPSLVRSFTSGDGKVVTYVDEPGEIVISDDGSVIFQVTSGNGIPLNEFIGYYPNDDSGYSFNDKIFAVKRIVNRFRLNNGFLSFSIVGVDYDADTASLKLYLKLFAEGILVTGEKYDAVFEIKQDNLVYAKFSAVICTPQDSSDILIPQKYAFNLIDSSVTDNMSEAICCPMMVPHDSYEDIMAVKWSVVSFSDIKESKDGNG